MENFPIFCAAEKGDLEEVKHLIEHGVSVDIRDSGNRTPLHWAAKCGRFEVAKYLLRNNCICNQIACDGTTAVLLAAEHGHRGIVDLLFQFGAHSNSCSEFGKWTVLHHASKRGWTETVHRIVQSARADNIDAKTSLGTTPLMLASEEGHAGIVRLLVWAGAQVNLCDEDGWTALHWASKKGLLPVVKIIAETAACDLNAKNSSGNTPLHIACGMNNVEIIEELLKAGATTDLKNTKNETAFRDFPMHEAAEKGDLQRVKHLIKLGISVDSRDSDGRSPLHRAALKGWYEVAQLLVQNKCDVNLKAKGFYSGGWTPLLCAAAIGQKKIVDLLLQCGAQVNCADESDTTFLFHVICHGWTDVVLRIIESGEVDVNGPGSRPYENPLLVAAQRGYAGITEMLILAGAEVHRYKNMWRESALHAAAEYGYPKVVHILLKQASLNLNDQDSLGYTPLHLACSNGNGEIVRQLLVAGADTTLKNIYDETALSCGIEDGNLTVEEIKLLVQRGAFFEDGESAEISEIPDVKEFVLKDVNVCTQSIVNKFNRQMLPALYSNPHFAGNLPSIEVLKLSESQTCQIANYVESEIEARTFCNVVEAKPILLSLMCVQRLLTQDSTRKRSASQAFSIGNSAQKKHCLC